MHELSLAMSIVDIASEEGERLGGRVSAVHLRLGPLAGVAKDALLFSYDMACQDTPVAGSRLVIEEMPEGRELQVVALEIEE
jgi:hydrogenase nickel incorporation protein HypA/HybF